MITYLNIDTEDLSFVLKLWQKQKNGVIHDWLRKEQLKEER
jgi:hypothetical protein